MRVFPRSKVRALQGLWAVSSVRCTTLHPVFTPCVLTTTSRCGLRAMTRCSLCIAKGGALLLWGGAPLRVSSLHLMDVVRMMGGMIMRLGACNMLIGVHNVPVAGV